MKKTLKSSKITLAPRVLPAMLLCLMASSSFLYGMEKEKDKENITIQKSKEVLSYEEKKLALQKKVERNIHTLLETVKITNENVRKPVSVLYLQDLEETQKINYEKLYTLQKGSHPVWDEKGSNLVALAICSGHGRALQKCLEIIPNINSEDLNVWGYRQPYNLAHLALDPSYPFCPTVPLENRYQIIDALSKKGLNFNYIPESKNYQNPPFHCGNSWTYSRLWSDNYDALLGRGLLAGADPLLLGSSHYGCPYYSDEKSGMINSYSSIYEYALNFALKGTDYSRATVYTKRILKLLKEKRLQALNKLDL